MSREIDRRVAEVLGLRVSTLCFCSDDEPGGVGSYQRGNRVVDIHINEHCGREVGIRYSTDIAAAIGALEEFVRPRGIGCELNTFRMHPWCCDFINLQPNKIVASGYGDTLPLAICNAIISAKEKESSHA